MSLRLQAQVEVQLRGSQQKMSGLQSELARAECLLDSHAVAKMKLPLFPMSPLAAPPVRHDKDKENSGSRLAKGSRHQVLQPSLSLFACWLCLYSAVVGLCLAKSRYHKAELACS